MSIKNYQSNGLQNGKINSNNSNLCAKERQLRQDYDFEAIIGHDPKLIELLDLIAKIKDTDLPVLIEGESGTGKELVARALHFTSKRQKFPLITINCGAIPENLMESEFFGYEKGAFTGAVSNKKGKFEAAGKGTIFLDEIDELSLDLQVKLLRVIQWGEFTSVGSVRAKKTDARIIAASNQNLKMLVSAGTFRHDLFYRLNVLRIDVPPLCERKKDVPLLCKYFLALHGPKLGFSDVAISNGALQKIMHYNFPGNIRELENIIMRAILFANGGTIHQQHLPDEILSTEKTRSFSKSILDWPFAKAKAKIIRDFEIKYILHKLEIYNGVVLQAAKDSGMYEANFRRKIQQYGIDTYPAKNGNSTSKMQANKLDETSF